jgi:LAGLIDADG DNA endonuclease family
MYEFDLNKVLIHKEYLLHLYHIFNNLCINQPKLDKHFNKITEKIYESIYFTSITLPCINEYYYMFYNSNRTKIIPININELLTPIELAYWAMDNGYKKESGFILCTENFTKDENLVLIKVLKKCFNLNCTLYKKEKIKYRIYIKAKISSSVINLVKLYFHSKMLYKIN